PEQAGHASGQVGIYEARFDGDDVHASLREAVPERFEEVVQGRLRGAVGWVAAAAAVGGDRGDPDDRAGARALESARRLVQPGHGADDVHLDDQAVFLRTVLIRRDAGLHTGREDHQVEAAQIRSDLLEQ